MANTIPLSTIALPFALSLSPPTVVHARDTLRPAEMPAAAPASTDALQARLYERVEAKPEDLPKRGFPIGTPVQIETQLWFPRTHQN
ncbi:hypothetical protein [Jannaschia donghaensis]|uniref:Uncharacterized protein n=1 Tax=Jannaschia donghaensis TaxID=420998 RepID=A0A0M6YPA1_9RHOB|nr:hypothetical protein [Jannaschia donghaensis]CTQ51475.1 hypothetical protein JDO7802_03515 [Jannaschia donghaensis]